MLRAVNIFGSRVFAYLKKTFTAKKIRQHAPLFIVLVAVFTSFIYGWYFDGSKPMSGKGWADQTSYYTAAARFSDFELPRAGELHYAIGYPLLGTVGGIFDSDDPFMVVSLVLLLASVTLCFLAVTKLFGKNWAVLFILFLFYWDLVGRSFSFASELFVVPWNIQVLFLAMAFYLWLFATKAHQKPSWRLVLIACVLSGFAILTREEAALFVLPAIALFILITKAGIKKLLIAGIITVSFFIPQFLVKLNAYGSITNSGRSDSYSDIRSHYLQPDLFERNLKEVVINSSYTTGAEASRPALLEAAPWLWLSPIGLGLILVLKKYPVALKTYVLVSLALVVFYLSGANMSAQKLRFHCLRYIAPGMIVLNLGTLVAAKETFTFTAEKVKSKNGKFHA
ncbi:MAG: glycosyltransferase family 39 protein [Candidatus Saccharibacteria bacterium]|nr:glycosyltransferase family 39 protein [Candidatus Saccharibacteria bacterium]